MTISLESLERGGPVDCGVVFLSPETSQHCLFQPRHPPMGEERLHWDRWIRVDLGELRWTETPTPQFQEIYFFFRTQKEAVSITSQPGTNTIYEASSHHKSGFCSLIDVWMVGGSFNSRVVDLRLNCSNPGNRDIPQTHCHS